ncbi:50S ribosomal protein L17 [Patescibacteria group bacterium]|nr:50S ribosomal protein L17 [Patescibacteria group bacterium]
MRHRKFGKKLGRNHHQRKALLKSLVRAVFTHGSINTTMAKAEAVSPLIEKICTRIKKADLSSKRYLYRYLQDRKWVKIVEEAFLKVFPDRNSNFLKISKVKKRQGDDATIVNLAFVKTVSFNVGETLAVARKKTKESLSSKNLLGPKNKPKRSSFQAKQKQQASVGTTFAVARKDINMKKKTSQSELTRRGKSK